MAVRAGPADGLVRVGAVEQPRLCARRSMFGDFASVIAVAAERRAQVVNGDEEDVGLGRGREARRQRRPRTAKPTAEQMRAEVVIMARSDWRSVLGGFLAFFFFLAELRGRIVIGIRLHHLRADVLPPGVEFARGVRCTDSGSAAARLLVSLRSSARL